MLHYCCTAMLSVAEAKRTSVAIVPVPFRAVFLCAATSCLSIVLVNMSLAYNSVAVFQVFKLFATPLTVVVEYCLGQIVLDRHTTSSVVLVVFGIALATFEPVHFSLIGTVCGLTQCLVQTMVLIVFRHYQTSLSISAPQLLYYSAPMAAALMLLTLPWMKLESFHWSVPNVALIGLSCVFAAFIQITSVYVVALSQATTYMVLTNGAPILASVVFYRSCSCCLF
jgi:solute carrier family 35 protein E3